MFSAWVRDLKAFTVNTNDCCNILSSFDMGRFATEDDHWALTAGIPCPCYCDQEKGANRKRQRSGRQVIWMFAEPGASPVDVQLCVS